MAIGSGLRSVLSSVYFDASIGSRSGALMREFEKVTIDEVNGEAEV